MNQLVLKYELMCKRICFSFIQWFSLKSKQKGLCSIYILVGLFSSLKFPSIDAVWLLVEQFRDSSNYRGLFCLRK